MTANLAAALFAEGKQTAALDADVWGYSIPRMLGVHGRPMVSAERKIIPLEAHGGIKAISIEFFLDAEDQAITWRGPMLHKAIRQFLEDVEWGELDYLLIDLPPGTGDVTMTLAQLLPQSKFVIVTTPQAAAQKVAKRAAETAHALRHRAARRDREHVRLHDATGEVTIFGEGGGQAARRRARRAAARQDPAPGGAADRRRRGQPLVLTDPDAPASQAIFHAARGIIAATPQEAPVLQSASPFPADVSGTAAADGAVAAS